MNASLDDEQCRGARADAMSGNGSRMCASGRCASLKTIVENNGRSGGVTPSVIVCQTTAISDTIRSIAHEVEGVHNLSLSLFCLSQA